MLMHSEENSVQKVKIPFRQLHQATLIHIWEVFYQKSKVGTAPTPEHRRIEKQGLFLFLYLYLDRTNHSPQSPPPYDGVFCGSSSFAVSWSHWDQAMVKPGLGSGLAGLSSRTSPLDQTEAGNILRSVSVCGFHPQSSRGPAQKKKKIQKAQADWKLS